MELFALYLQFLSEICEGTRPAPAGITVPASGAEEKVQAVQQAALEMGIDAFVRACAEAEGREVPQEWYDNFDLAQVMQALGQFGQAQAAEPEAPAETAPADAADDAADQTPKIEEPDGPRNACEVLLDCCLLEEIFQGDLLPRCHLCQAEKAHFILCLEQLHQIGEQIILQ